MPKEKTKKVINVIDLFAGVGGFRVGLNRANKRNGHGVYKTVWSNQWEPSTKIQHASKVYINRFGEENHSNEDIAREVLKEIEKSGYIPSHDLLVGGFPCQDYSVARTLSQAAGISGKKGVLWWEIYKILEHKIAKGKPTNYIFLENVDRLLKSPASQRGRDFAVMLSSLAGLGYAVEWRVINAADYGLAQRRRRTFILGYRKGTKPYIKIDSLDLKKGKSLEDWFLKESTFAKSFPIYLDGSIGNGTLHKDVKHVSDNFNKEKGGATTPFDTAGLMIKHNFYSVKAKPKYKGPYTTLGDILLPLNKVPKEFYIKKSDIPRWQYLKGAKHEPRKSSSGHTFIYTEGPMAFPDPLNKPSRTIITGEGGSTPSRFKHVVRQGRVLRRLTPVELELLCGFDPDHTLGQTDAMRAFFMGNALVVDIIEKIGRELLKKI